MMLYAAAARMLGRLFLRNMIFAAGGIICWRIKRQD